jgi:gliding motility-associated-like protein
VVRIQVGDETDCFVPTLFTPNGDGVNDVLIIPCLETTRYPGNAIKVFNEWGGLVFSASPYGNDWMGTHDGKALPVGTYFYIMDFGDGSAPKRTFLVLER